MKAALSALISLLFLIGCQLPKEEESAKKFVNEYNQLAKNYHAILENARTTDSIQKTYQETQLSLQFLLGKYAWLPSVGKVETIRTKINIALNRPEEAKKSLNNLMINNKISEEALLKLKVMLLLAQHKEDQAHHLLLKIGKEALLDDDLVRIWSQLACQLLSSKIQEAYIKKILALPTLPASINLLQPTFYAILAEISCLRANFLNSQQYFKKAISLTKDASAIIYYQARLNQLKWLGKPYKNLLTDTWLNTTASNPLILPSQRSNWILFWAPWCTLSEDVWMAALKYENKLKKDGINFIGYTRLYGYFKNKKQTLANLAKADELIQLNNYLKNKGIHFPIAISYEGDDFEKYQVATLPLLICVNSEGIIENIIGGDFCSKFINEKFSTNM